MRKTATCLILTIVAALAVAKDAEKPARPAKPDKATKPAKPTYTPTSGYESRPLDGWTLRIHKDLLKAEHSKLLGDVLAEVGNHFYRIRRVVPPEAIARLRKVVIWVEYRNPRQTSACYHPSRGWLVANDYNPDKAKAVELGSAVHFLRAVGHQPWMILHELAHAYHDQVLDWDHPKVKAAYDKAKKAGTYEKVLIWNGRVGRHYAMTNHKEYFAENTEAYFGTNDIYPFVKAELKKHDPTMYEALGEVWGVKRKKP
jgi:hypothetical protein